MTLHAAGQILFLVLFAAVSVFLIYSRIRSYTQPSEADRASAEAKASREAAKAHAATMAQTSPEDD